MDYKCTIELEMELLAFWELIPHVLKVSISNTDRAAGEISETAENLLKIVDAAASDSC